MENKLNEAADQGKANFDVDEIVDQLIERILDKRPLPLESDCLLDICIKVKDVFPLAFTEHISFISEYVVQLGCIQFVPVMFQYI